VLLCGRYEHGIGAVLESVLTSSVWLVHAPEIPSLICPSMGRGFSAECETADDDSRWIDANVGMGSWRSSSYEGGELVGLALNEEAHNDSRVC
jgi:hypothetical protein